MRIKRMASACSRRLSYPHHQSKTNHFNSLPETKINMVRILTSITLFTVLLVGGTAAHPGDHHPDISHLEREHAFHKRTAIAGAEKMSRCADTSGSVRQSAIQRRAGTLERLRQERGFTPQADVQHRNKAEVSYYDSLNHNLTSIVKSGSYEELFGSNASCVLGRAETIGPYYVEGELIRSNITEDQIGIPMHMEIQFVDVNTCKPVPALFIDIWGANATGGYSGADSPAGFSGFGGLNSTFLRGIQITDEHGVASFDLIISGHYYPRATHTHIVAWGNATTFTNVSPLMAFTMFPSGCARNCVHSAEVLCSFRMLTI